jgi:hypothetical protein
MAVISSGAAGFRVEYLKLVTFDRVGEIPGVVVEVVAGGNGPGIGYLQCAGPDMGIAWKAPGSNSFGVPVVAAVDGSYVLEDGLDTNKWVQVSIHREYLVAGAMGRVYLRDRYENHLSHVDVSAAQAAAGNVASWELDLYNISAVTFHQLKVWIDPTVSGLEISDDDATWVSPTTEETALALPDLAGDSTDTLYVRRTIVAGAIADPAVLNWLHVSFQRV